VWRRFESTTQSHQRENPEDSNMNYERLSESELEAIEAESEKMELWEQEAKAVCGVEE